MLTRNERKLPVAIKPELPLNNTLQQQYDKVEELLNMGYDRVFWIVDLDVILKETREKPTGQRTTMDQFIRMRKKLLKKSRCRIVVNNPCLEYWFLLHYIFTGKAFYSCDETVKMLKTRLSDYEKSKKYFTRKNNDIYWKLLPALKNAIQNCKRLGTFDIHYTEKSMCEMEMFFEDPLLEDYF